MLFRIVLTCKYNFRLRPKMDTFVFDKSRIILQYEFMFTLNKYKNFPDWLLGQQEKSKQSQTAGNDADNLQENKMSTTFYTKDGTRHEEKWFQYHSNSEIAREIIMNALHDAVKKDRGEYENIYLQHVENDLGEGRAVAVRKKMVQYIWRIFNKYHTYKFDMSGHPIVHDVFHVLEKTGDMPKKYKQKVWGGQPPLIPDHLYFLLACIVQVIWDQ